MKLEDNVMSPVSVRCVSKQGHLFTLELTDPIDERLAVVGINMKDFSVWITEMKIERISKFKLTEILCHMLDRYTDQGKETLSEALFDEQGDERSFVVYLGRANTVQFDL